jgi:hypothetical protein
VTGVIRRFRSQKARRLLVVGLLGVFVLNLEAGWMNQQPFWWASMLLMLAGSVILNKLGMDGSGAMDERQLRARMETLSICYYILVGAVVLGMTLARLSDHADWNLFGNGFMFLVILLPPAILAWKEPDLPDEE